MHETHEILGFVLFGLLGVYLGVFYGSLAVSWIYGSYLHDGDKKIWSLPHAIVKKMTWMNFDDEYPLLGPILIAGVIFPAFYVVLSMFLIGATKVVGMPAIYCLSGLLLVWGILYTLRGLIRLNKKLDKHASDKNAHGG